MIVVVETRRITQALVFREKGLRTIPKTKVNSIARWIDSRVTTHVCKGRCWLLKNEPVEDGSVLYMGDNHFTLVHGKGSVVLEFSSENSITLFNVLDTIFDENRFSSILRLKDIMPNSGESQKDDHSNDIPNEGSSNQIGSQYSYRYSIEEDLRTYNEAMQSRDIFKRKMKFDGTIDKFKARLVSEALEKKGINYFDTYPLVTRVTTIRLLIALAAIHNLVSSDSSDGCQNIIFKRRLKGVYVKQEGFVMPDNEHKIHLLLVDGCSCLGRCAISWAFKKQTCITSSTMKFEFVALAAAGKEA
uniref:Retrovirus-related Pol polyprotein from transposon TNT 1-94-like beta-barrel domain-containing protein n=1 Tax=Tanacetum cinerariifolium TaxID=118510 RepID=A0A699I2X7_TANCI|nr:hypothetical protein [Tanacetum cinerariifolium]